MTSICVLCLSRSCLHAHKRLRPRDVQVLLLLAKGRSHQQIADALGLKHASVRQIAHHLYPKIDARDRLQASLWARDHIDLLESPGEPT